MTEKTFNIQQLKNDLFQKWLKEEDIEDQHQLDNLFDEGKVQGVEDFLDFIEDEWNESHKEDKVGDVGG